MLICGGTGGKQNHDNNRCCNCRYVRLAVLLGFISIGGLGALASPVHSLTVVNVRSGASSYSSGHFDFAVGVTVVPLDGAGAGLLADLGADFGTTLDVTSSYVVDVSPTAPGYTIATVAEPNMLDAWVVGFGVGLTLFGWGWIYRLTRRIPEI
jgi:hypothetical protein